jgi:hypothetical protein
MGKKKFRSTENKIVGANGTENYQWGLILAVDSDDILLGYPYFCPVKFCSALLASLALSVLVILTRRPVVWRVLILESSHKSPDCSQYLNYVSSLLSTMLD